MSKPGLAKSERAALCDLLAEVGPEAPTLCEGWNTLDLAAHLVVRERRPDSGPGLVVPALAGWTERVRQGAKRKGYAALVEQVRNGPPSWSPFALVDEMANGTEYFIHHEDVRRGRPGWEPRHLDAATEDRLWQLLKTGRRLLLRRCRVGVEARRPDGQSMTLKSGQPSVTLVGAPAELTLYLAGRKGAARVEVEGDPDAVRRFEETPLGL